MERDFLLFWKIFRNVVSLIYRLFSSTVKSDYAKINNKKVGHIINVFWFVMCPIFLCYFCKENDKKIAYEYNRFDDL